MQLVGRRGDRRAAQTINVFLYKVSELLVDQLLQKINVWRWDELGQEHVAGDGLQLRILAFEIGCELLCDHLRRERLPAREETQQAQLEERCQFWAPLRGGNLGLGRISSKSILNLGVTSAAGVSSRMDGPRNVPTDLIRVMTYNWVGVRTAVWLHLTGNGSMQRSSMFPIQLIGLLSYCWRRFLVHFTSGSQCLTSCWRPIFAQLPTTVTTQLLDGHTPYVWFVCPVTLS